MTTTQDISETKDSASGGASNTSPGRERAAQAYQAARERTSAAYAAARERAGSALESARDTASRAGRRTADEVDANPMIALAGGLAIGALVAALLPKTRREDALLGTAGRRINETAREAGRAAREAGREQLDILGISREAARRKLDEFTGRAVSAVESSAKSAAKKVKSKK